MSGLIFDEKTMIDGNIFKFEERLKSHTNRYIEGGAILTTYFSQDENASTVDRGTQDIEELFGKHAPLRYNIIEDLPLYGNGANNPENTDEQQIEDINVEGTYVIQPSTIVPKVMDFFIIKHLKMTALFEVKNVTYDSMKVEGFYQIQYRLHSTSEETIQMLKNQVINRYHTELNTIGSNKNPIIREDDFVYKSKVLQMVQQMIESYKALYYNTRHNCFLFMDNQTGMVWFDSCGNEFIAKHSLMNVDNSTNVVMLHDKLNDPNFPILYNNSVYKWLELHAPNHMLQKFYFSLKSSEEYPYSSFVQWGDGEVQIMQPLAINDANIQHAQHSMFDETQFMSFMDNKHEPVSEYDKLIWKYINKERLSIHDVSLYTADALLTSADNRDIFLYTPIVIYIIREILEMD